MTLLEVLFSIMVAATGLLGALAVLPAALSQARKGQNADLSATAAHSGVGAFDAELMRRPDRWLAWDETNNRTRFLPSNDQTLNAAFTFNVAGSTLNGRPLFGRAFCIDPMGFLHNVQEDPGGNYDYLWSWFPAVPETNPSPNAAPNASRMVRLALHNNNPSFLNNAAYPMSYVQADKVFRMPDELTYERLKDETLPAVQLYTQMQTAGGNVAARRQELGRFTWFATLVPKLDRAQAQLGEEYVLSIVVCLARSGEATHVPNPNVTPRDHPYNEWTATILGANGINASGDFHASGIGGGEVTLSTFDPNVETGLDLFFYSAEAIDVKRGSWVLLGRTLPGASGPIQHYHWYRISDAEENTRYVDVDLDGNNDRYQRDVTLVGPDWPADVDGNGVSEACDVIIVPQVVYVYERTIKIDTGAAP